MSDLDILDYLISSLLNEMPQYASYARRFGNDMQSKKKLLRSLMNLLPPIDVSDEFLKYQNLYLQNELQNMGLVDCKFLPLSGYRKIALWRGDIVRLKTEAIVNACNEDALGCFVPNHNCIDNTIHSYAGIQLRKKCYELMKARGHKLGIGEVLVTEAYNLPTKYIFHVLGPSVRGRTTFLDQTHLRDCYLNVLREATKMNVKTITFPCISAGEQGYPKKEAAKIATETVKEYILEEENSPAVIFDVFTDIDEKYYTHLLFE